MKGEDRLRTVEGVGRSLPGTKYTGIFKRKKRQVPEQSGGGYDNTGRQWRRAGIPVRTCAISTYSRRSRPRPQSCSSKRRTTRSG